MSRRPEGELRRGWTTGACATAALRAALMALWGEGRPDRVRITLPRGERPVFAVEGVNSGPGWAEAGVIKDAGDDPDVTHQALIRVRVDVLEHDLGRGVVFAAGEGVGMVTKPGLPVPVGAPAINPVPRQMMCETVAEMAARLGQAGDVRVTVSVPGGAALAEKTWNPRLGIVGGLSILGTTGIVRPFSCSAWIASIHRGVDVARASGTAHVAGCTGATSERVVQALYGLEDHAMLDMGDFAGGMMKYIAAHPVDRVTLGGGLGKLTKFAQGAGDLHSGRSQVDFAALEARFAVGRVAQANTTAEVLGLVGAAYPTWVARAALAEAARRLGPEISVDVVVIDRAGAVLARA